MNMKRRKWEQPFIIRTMKVISLYLLSLTINMEGTFSNVSVGYCSP